MCWFWYSRYQMLCFGPRCKCDRTMVFAVLSPAFLCYSCVCFPPLLLHIFIVALASVFLNCLIACLTYPSFPCFILCCTWAGNLRRDREIIDRWLLWNVVLCGRLKFCYLLRHRMQFYQMVWIFYFFWLPHHKWWFPAIDCESRSRFRGLWT